MREQLEWWRRLKALCVCVCVSLYVVGVRVGGWAALLSHWETGVATSYFFLRPSLVKSCSDKGPGHREWILQIWDVVPASSSSCLNGFLFFPCLRFFLKSTSTLVFSSFFGHPLSFLGRLKGCSRWPGPWQSHVLGSCCLKSFRGLTLRTGPP